MELFKTKSKKGSFWKHEYNALANYNSEVSRGIVHTDFWISKMEQLQKEYNEELLESHGGRCVPYIKGS